MEMIKKEQTETEVKMEMKKKEYSPPTFEAIGEVRDITKGGGSTANADGNGYWDNNPSDPNG